MHWGLRIALLAALGGIGGVIGTVAYYRRHRTASAVITRMNAAPFWVMNAVAELQNGSCLKNQTAATVGGLQYNQGRFLARREFAPADEDGHTSVPFDARLTDEWATGAFIYMDDLGGYHLFTRGHVATDHLPDRGVTCVSAKLTVTPLPYTSK